MCVAGGGGRGVKIMREVAVRRGGVFHDNENELCVCVCFRVKAIDTLRVFCVWPQQAGPWTPFHYHHLTDMG